jgi:ABC-2 type transport system permease protein
VSALRALGLAKLRALGHSVAAVRDESRLKVATVSLAVVLLWLGTFALALGLFRWMDRFGAELLGTADLSIVALLAPRALAVFALLLLTLLVFSNALLAYPALFRTREVAFLATTPISSATLFAAVFVEVVLFSSWSSAYVGSPVLLAYGLVRHAPIGLYLAAAACFPPFVVIPAALGALLALAAARWVPRISGRVVAVAGVVLVVAAVLVVRSELRSPAYRESVNPTRLVELAGRADNPFLPSFWLKEAILTAGERMPGETTFYFFLLVANAALAVWLAAVYAGRAWPRGWSALADGPRGAARERRTPPWLVRVLQPLPVQVRSLTLKDLLGFAREPAQWSQAAIFFGVLGVYMATMRTGYRGYGEAFWQSWITMLNTVACLLVLATLTTRFVFPLLSLEGRRFWLLGLAPLSRRRLVMQKFWLSVLSTSLVTVGLAVLSSWRLRLPLPLFALALFTVGAASVALSGLAVGLGGLYPDFTADSPARAVSGLGGTLTFVLSAVYVAVVGAAETVVLQWARLGRATGARASLALVSVGAVVFILVVSALCAWLPMRLGIRHLERAEL